MRLALVGWDPASGYLVFQLNRLIPVQVRVLFFRPGNARQLPLPLIHGEIV